MKEFIFENAPQWFALTVILVIVLAVVIWLGRKEWKKVKRLNFHLKVLAKLETDDVGRDYLHSNDCIQHFVIETNGASAETLVAEFLDLFTKEDLKFGLGWHIRKKIHADLMDYFLNGSATISTVTTILTRIYRKGRSHQDYDLGFLKNLVVEDVLFGKGFDFGILATKRRVFSIKDSFEQVSFLVTSLGDLKSFEQQLSLDNERKLIQAHREEFEKWVNLFHRFSPQERLKMADELPPVE